MKSILTAICLLSAASHLLAEQPAAPAKPGAWVTSLTAAQQLAQKENKDILIVFTGSDWSGWSIKLEKNVLFKPEFIKTARKTYILCQLDFPKKSLPDAQKEANSQARKKYHVRGFPTAVIVDASGRPYARTSERNADADDYLAHLDKLQLQKATRDALLTEATTLHGPKKARALERALAIIPRQNLSFYEAEITAIDQADPADTSGFVNRYRAEQAAHQLRRTIHPYFKNRQFKEVAPAVDLYIKKNKPTGESLQTALLYKLQAALILKQHEEAKKLADRVTTINPASRPARYAKMVKKRLARLSTTEDKSEKEKLPTK